MDVRGIVSCALVTAVLGLHGACAVPESTLAADDPAAVDADGDRSREALTAWLEAQCPDGMAIQRVDPSTGDVREIACEEARVKALNDDVARVHLVRLHETTLRQDAALSGEHVGEAPQLFTPVGFACGLIAASLGLLFNWPFGGHAGCKDPHAENPRACEAVTGGGSVALGILCALI